MMISERMTVSVLNQHDRRQRESLRPRHDLKPFDEVIEDTAKEIAALFEEQAKRQNGKVKLAIRN